jgi:type I restriction enzyme R subunit
VVEAKSVYMDAGDGLQQAKNYAEMLELQSAYSTNGIGIVKYDFGTKMIKERDAFPTPDELWKRLGGISNKN